LAMSLRQALAAYMIDGIEWSRMVMGLIRLFARAAYHGDPELSETWYDLSPPYCVRWSATC